MSDGQPRQVQCKLGVVDADGNWQLGSPASSPPRAPALPCSGTSGSDEDSDEEDDESDSGSSPSLDD